MSTDTDFPGWLQAELKRQGMSQADLARESGLSTAAISRIMGGSRGVGAEACNAIAKALNLPPETVFRRAGLLPEETETDPPSFTDWVKIWLGASEEERDRLLARAEQLAKENKKKKDK
jgi:transcriptional regulator with XRE-family HTH domain